MMSILYTKPKIEIKTVGILLYDGYQTLDALNTLEEANQGMMDWIHNIKNIPVQTVMSEQGKHGHHGTSTKGEMLSAEAVLQIQQDQKVEIELVKVAMKNSIEEAKQLIVKIEGL
jgi:hypothetical protein